MFLPDSKLPGQGTSIFAVMSGLAAQHQAVNLSQGFPDFAVPPRLVELMHQAMQKGQNQYAPMHGAPPLLAALSKKCQDAYGVKVAEDEILITAGATEALYTAISVLIHPGQEAILFDPAYDSYEPCVRLNGGKAVHLPLTQPGFNYDWDRVKDAINPRTRLIIVNSPHNPTGKLITPADWQALAEIIRDKPIYVLSDEVYEHITFDGRKHHSLLEVAELRPRAFVVSSFGKTFHATGWKVGYAIAPAPMIRQFALIHQFLTYAVNTPAQHAMAAFLEEAPQHWQSLPRFYQEKRDMLLELFKDTPFDFEPAQGTYFQLADYSKVSDLEDEEFAQRLTAFGVATIPLSPFYQQKPSHRLVRFCFAKKQETLQLAAERLRKLTRQSLGA